MLLEESNLAKVADPAAGSGGIETLTRQLCEAAWSLFQEIEKAGGVFAALEQGLIQRKVAATRKAREANIAKRREVLTGASEFPNLHEAQVAVLRRQADRARALWRSEDSSSIRCRRCGWPRPSRRCATDRTQHPEEIRRAAQRFFSPISARAADFTARATFAKSFFETGGIEAVDTEGFTDPAALAAAFKASGATLACLCSSDKVYAGQAAAAAKALQAAGARHIYLAGRPGEQEAALRAAGVSDFIFAGGDALAALKEAWRRMERA